MEVIVLLVGMFAVMGISTIWKGFVLVKLWTWFIVPIFTQVPSLTIVPAIGISLVISFLTYADKSGLKKDKNRVKAIYDNIFNSFFVPLCALVIGWIVKSFM